MELKELKKKKINFIYWITQRFNLLPIGKHVVYHRVARQPWYFGDGAALLMLFSILLATGMFMALSYTPDTNTAYDSVKQLTSETVLGWFVRALHYWSAGMMVVVMLYHVLRHIVLGGYLPPREGIWLVGVLLLFLILSTSIIGYMLRWDERGVYAFQVALNIFYKIPWIGDDIVRFVQGGQGISSSTLSRLYAVHILFIPFSILALVGYHLYLVLTFGATTPLERKHAPESAEEQIALRTAEKESESHGQDFFPYTAIRSGTFALIIFIVVVILALVFGPRELFPKANFTSTSRPIEEWWMHWYSALAALLPPAVASVFYWTFPIATFVFLVALPFLDRGSNRGARRRPLAIISAVLVLIGILGLTGLRLRSPWTAWPRTELPPLPLDTLLSEQAEQGRKLFTAAGCYNCHAIGGHGSGVGPNLTGIQHRLSKEELFRFVSHPPDGVPMPAYGEKLSPAELNAVVEFVLVAQTFPREF